MSDAVNKPAHYNQGSIECIDAMQVVLTPEEFRGHLKGNVFKYLWREKKKNGIEDLRKAKWYLDRLIKSFEANEPEQPVIKQSLTPEPPEGWRFLEVGEVIRKGDRYFDGNKWKDRDWAVKETYSLMHQKTIRRNRFEIGEKVVDQFKKRICVVKEKIGGDENPREYKVEMLGTKRNRYFFPYQLAPYIEETK